MAIQSGYHFNHINTCVYCLQTQFWGGYRNYPVPPSVQMSYKRNISFPDETSHSRRTYNLRMCMKEDSPAPKYFKKDHLIVWDGGHLFVI